jgi:cytochrome c-type biogenesis protein CcmE
MTATTALTVRPRRRAPVWISVVNTCTAAVVLWFYALPSDSTYLVVLYG